MTFHRYYYRQRLTHSNINDFTTDPVFIISFAIEFKLLAAAQFRTIFF